MDDLKERLRAENLWQKDELEYIQPLCREAADRIEALEAQLAARDAEIADYVEQYPTLDFHIGLAVRGLSEGIRRGAYKGDGA